jgi:hypothetical protein
MRDGDGTVIKVMMGGQQYNQSEEHLSRFGREMHMANAEARPAVVAVQTTRAHARRAVGEPNMS